MKTLLKSLLLVVTLGWAASFSARADFPGDHPGYLHALSDLRLARAYLSRDNPGPRDHFAIDEVDAAIHEIKQASIDDGKNLDDHPPVDVNLDFHGRFHKALDLLNHAHHDIAQDEDNGFARGLQHRALEHIDKAHHVVKEIINS